jgi:WD40 repeat protein
MKTKLILAAILISNVIAIAQQNPNLTMVIQENHRFTGPYFANEIEGASFSPDGKIFVTCSNDCTAKIWSRDGLLIRTLRDTLIVRDFMNGVVFRQAETR